MEEMTEIVDMALKTAEVKANALVVLLFDIVLFMMWIMLAKYYSANKDDPLFEEGYESTICIFWFILNILFSVAMLMVSAFSFYEFFTLMFYQGS